jgi:hypothetical protein
MTVAQTAALRLDALQCLVCMLSSLACWIDNADSATTDTTPLSTGANPPHVTSSAKAACILINIMIQCA